MPIRTNFIFDTDEGQELMKALLYARGFPLYDSIWSDQPPLLTIFLVHWFNFFGQSVFAGRLLILCFSALLVWCFFQTLKITVGKPSAFIGIVLLSFSGNFLRLSVSVMIGIPSLAFAMLSVYTLLLYLRQYKLGILILSGIAIAISLQFKMFTVFLIPLQILVLFYRLYMGEEKNSRKLYYAGGISSLWIGSCLLSFLAIGLAFHSLNLGSIFQFHLEGDLKSVFINENSFSDVIVMYVQDLDCFLLSLLGIRVLWSKRKLDQSFPLLWLGTATLILLNHKPIWYHHSLLLSLPTIWLASYGVSTAIPSFQNFKRPRSNVVMGLCLFAAIAVPIKLGVIHWQNRAFVQDSQAKLEIVERILDYQKETHWVLTDNPMYAFAAGLRVPPEIAVLSRKRIASGEINPDRLYALLAQYQPEQVILERFPEVYEPIRPYLDANYTQIGDRGPSKHYVLRRLVENR
ncbi:MAG: glycosyltransferase family 39 protein [Cyanobacteriota bacterium]|nr:glycosyltransferase family 39 protein [Cyanobacteriota bacterium]